MSNCNSVQSLFHTVYDNAQQKPKYLRLAHSIVNAIEVGEFNSKSTLPSIDTMSRVLKLSRCTVEKSLRHLSDKGVILSAPGKGYYINLGGFRKAIKVCLILNKLSNQKKELHSALKERLGEEVPIDIFIYNNNFNSFSRIIDNVKRNFSHYLVVPHFVDNTTEADDLLRSQIPADKLIILDRKPEGVGKNVACIYENFRDDIYNSLEQLLDQLNKYHTLKLIFPKDSYHPDEIKKGLTLFCSKYGFKKALVPDMKREKVAPGCLYICLTDNDLADLVEKINSEGLILGQDVGLISYNESPVKKIIGNGITTFSTDYKAMGDLAADMILKQYTDQVKLPFKVTRRNSI